jgi:hypothetical protein
MPMRTAEFYAQRAARLTSDARSLHDDHPEKAEAEQAAKYAREVSGLMAARSCGSSPVALHPNEAEGDSSQ